MLAAALDVVQHPRAPGARGSCSQALAVDAASAMKNARRCMNQSLGKICGTLSVQ